MDTKWKGWKCGVSFLAFALGTCLLLGGLFSVVFCMVQLSPADVKDAFQTDFQETATFRREITRQLEDLVGRAAVAPPGAELELDGKPGSFLYVVRRDGLTLFASSALYGKKVETVLGETYNFALTFDGQRVSIRRDGQELDVYGDGFYQGGDQWYLPGYLNYPVEKEYKGIEVVLVAAQEPIPAVGAAAQGYDALYEAKGYVDRVRLVLLLLVALPLVLGLVLGLVLFVWYLLWQKYKAEADRRLAALTRRIWLEFKLVLLPLLGYGGVGVLSTLFWLIGRGRLFGLEGIAVFPISAVVLFVGYLYLNDLRYNKGGVFRHSFCVSAVRWMRDMVRVRTLKYPVQRRMALRANLFFALSLPLAVGSICFGAVLFLWSRGTRKRMAFFLLLFFIGVALLIGLVNLFLRNRKTTADLGALLDRIDAIRRGDFTRAPVLPEDSDLHASALALDDLQSGLGAALEERTRSERMKVELIANVSHDLKTPLTSILSYAELLRREEDLPAHVRDYVNILSAKAERLKSMVQEVFEVSKAASGNLPVKLETLDLAKLLRQTMADMEDPIGSSGLMFRVHLPDAVYIRADGDRLYRVFQNLIQNALQYALEGSRVFLTLAVTGGTAKVTLRNTSRDELPQRVDFTARFVRGDESRTDGGNGLGLSIAQSFTEACGGTLRVEAVADLFTATAAFPLTAERPAAEPETEPERPPEPPAVSDEEPSPERDTPPETDAEPPADSEARTPSDP